MESIKEKIQYVKNNPGNEDRYYSLLSLLNCEGMNYWDYMHNEENEPVNINSEMKYLKEEGLMFALAMLTAILREDHFSNGSLIERIENGDVDKVLERVLETI